MGLKGLIMPDIISAHEGNEKSIEKVIEHYGYIFERISEELKIQDQYFEDVNGAMLLGMLKTISQEESIIYFPLYAYRNMRKEAEKCLREIAPLDSVEEAREQDYTLEDTIDNICAEKLVEQMLKYLRVSSRDVLLKRFGISSENEDEMKSFKELSELLSDRQGSTTVANLNRISNAALKELRERFRSEYEEE